MSHRAVNIIRASNAMMAIEYIMYETRELLRDYEFDGNGKLRRVRNEKLSIAFLDHRKRSHFAYREFLCIPATTI